MKTIKIVNTQEVWVEWQDTIKITDAGYAQLENGALTAEDLFDRCKNMKQTDIWESDGANEFEYVKV